MGVVAEVGVLAHLGEHDPAAAARRRDELAAVNAALRAAGLPEHAEPESGVERVDYDLGPCDNLHALRRVAAHLSEGPDLPPAGDHPLNDPVLERRSRVPGRFARLLRGRSGGGPRPFAHLIEHSPSGGYYVPIDFSEPIVYGNDELIGSSQQLAAECDALGAALGVPHEVGPDDEELWAAVERPPEDGELWQRYGAESFVCVRLGAAAHHSISTGAVVAFV